MTENHVDNISNTDEKEVQTLEHASEPDSNQTTRTSGGTSTEKFSDRVNETTYKPAYSEWQKFFQTYPEAANTLINIKKFFYSVEEFYPDFEYYSSAEYKSMLESDYDDEFMDFSSYQLLPRPSDPITCFSEESKPMVAETLRMAFVDDQQLGTAEWEEKLRKFRLIASTEKVASLRQELEEKMASVKSVRAIIKLKKAINQRFDELDDFLPSLDLFYQARLKQNRPEINVESLQEGTGMTTTAELDSGLRSHNELRNRGKQKRPMYSPDPAWSTTRKEHGEGKVRQELGVLHGFVTYICKKSTILVLMFVLLTLSAIFSAIASNGDGLYTTLSNAVFALASFILVMPKIGLRPASNKVWGFALVAVFASVVSVVVYSSSTSASIWANFTSQFSQVLTTVLLIEEHVH